MAELNIQQQIQNRERQSRYRNNPANKDKIQNRQKLFKETLKQKGICLSCAKNNSLPDRNCCQSCKTLIIKSNQDRKFNLQEKEICGFCGQFPHLESLSDSKDRICETCYFKKRSRRHFKTVIYWQILKQNLEEQNYLCPYTGEKIVLGVNDSLDHIFPCSRFPEKKFDLDNVEWTTRKINTVKNELTKQEFLDLCSHIIQHQKNL